MVLSSANMGANIMGHNLWGNLQMDDFRKMIVTKYERKSDLTKYVLK